MVGSSLVMLIVIGTSRTYPYTITFDYLLDYCKLQFRMYLILVRHYTYIRFKF